MKGPAPRKRCTLPFPEVRLPRNKGSSGSVSDLWFLRVQVEEPRVEPGTR